ncbi:MAG: cytochrome bc complex cytochrome b subunit [Cyanobacteria bacterium SZAS LIN-3]|nr:cytochrome bc complex cytochrome b subunit [Cyanobacteria bacterium SZAS LIN-3]MBS2006831.1 cytochrome bc complex cytochrome b subunit [Cyanobacteria bacterium SZAS TMP-1]
MIKVGTTVSALSQFLKERFPVDKLNFHYMVEKKEVPIHRMSWGYYTGGLTMFFFMIQVITGLFLLFYYQPTVSDANVSVEFINRHVEGGALIRNMHAWSSSCMIFFAMVHLLTAFAMKSFVRPREITWIAGVILLFITFVFGFTGYLLPWNQIAVNATKVGLQSVEYVGQYLPGQLAEVPRILRETFQGESSVGQSTLGRFYALHVVILPIALVGLLGLHLLSVQLHGMSQGVDKPAKKAEKFISIFVFKDLTLWASVFMVLFVLALCVPFDSFLPFPLLAPFNALGSTPAGIKPEWYFYFVYYPLELLPFWVVLLGSIFGVAVLILTPWIFKGTSRRTLSFMATAAGAYLFVMTVFGEQIYEFFKH